MDLHALTSKPEDAAKEPKLETVVLEESVLEHAPEPEVFVSKAELGKASASPET